MIILKKNTNLNQKHIATYKCDNFRTDFNGRLLTNSFIKLNYNLF